MAEEDHQGSLRDEMEDLQLENLVMSDQPQEPIQSGPEGTATLDVQENVSASETKENEDNTPAELHQGGIMWHIPGELEKFPEHPVEETLEDPNTSETRKNEGNTPVELDPDGIMENIPGELEEKIPEHPTEETLEDNEDDPPFKPDNRDIEGNSDVVEGTDEDTSLDGRTSAGSGQGDSWTLLSLPGELLLKVFDFLDARLVIREVGPVCKMFHEIVSDNLEWKVRFKKRWRGVYPVVPVEDDDFNWKLACIEREETHQRWARQETSMDHFSLTMAHIAAIDCVHLMNNGELCATGSRDRTFQMWDLSKLDANNPEKSVKDARTKDVKAHKGWVWDITSLDHLMCTASWDCWLKLWDINDDMKCVHSMKGKTAFLSLVYQRDLIIAGAYDRSVYLFDPRVNENSLVAQLVNHKRPVLTVQADDHYIISGSEDKTIAIFDRRANSVYKKLNLDSFCMCMSYQHGQIWTGHRDGKVRVIDPTHGSFDIIQTYDVGHKGKITDIMYTTGALYTCSMDSTIRISDPNHNPETMCKLTTHTRDLTAMDLQCGVLASASSDLTAGIWRPKQDAVVEEFESY
ncbi:F-box/WD repeat-containing protein 9 [Strongylocentrotus purpuratus]|uniref:F-box domain-containing protein n=1 Tax=Strongylocentrotus purpuratus TaxID=7668 RepID=A0A7M7RG24_STRPU|nr:F-box/WD repeat-containing protein 9 [Strongylocentrotus purpuratus]